MRVPWIVLAAPVLLAQIHPPSAAQPHWIEVFNKINQEHARGVPLGTHDQPVANAWASALEAGPLHPSFASAAYETASYWARQGYDKALQVWKQAISAARQQNPDLACELGRNLASQYQNIGQLVKAASVVRGLLDEARQQTENVDGLIGALSQLASIEEQMGETEAAEAHFRELASLGSTNNLASFYQRQGRPAEAEDLFNRTIDNARQTGSARKVRQATQAYVQFLQGMRRNEDALVLHTKMMAELGIPSTPEERRMAVYDRQQQAHLLNAVGRKEEAVSLLKENVDRADDNQRAYALASLTRMLTAQQKYGDIETFVRQFRKSPAYSEDHSDIERSATSDQPPSIWKLMQPAQQAMASGNYDQGIVLAEKVFAAARERARSNPRSAATIVSLVHSLPGDRKDDRVRMFQAVLSILSSVTPPDHPWLGDAYVQISSAFPIDDTSAISRLLDRAERIFITTKGEGSLSLNQIDQRRRAQSQFAGNHGAAIAELKRVVDRTEAAAGPRSHQTIGALGDLAGVYQFSDNWPDEERTRLEILRRSERAHPNARVAAINVLARRYYEQGQFDQAMTYLDQAIEVARQMPEASYLVTSLLQQQEYFQRTKDQSGGSSGRWVNRQGIARTR